MRSKRVSFALLGLLGVLAAQQPIYKLFFRQAYVPANSPTAPDSVDIYVLIDSLPGYPYPTDTLASSNFPFFYNPLLLDMSGARVVHMHRFSSVSKPNYYDPITWPYTYGRVNVTVRRKLGYSGSGDIILPRVDTILGLRVPLLACGGSLKSILIWDSVPAAVLNSQLQNLKPYLRWRGPDTLELCPPLRGTLSFQNITPPPPRCVGDSVRFRFRITPIPGQPTPDSFIVRVQRDPVGGGPVQVYPNIVTQSGTDYSFSLQFAAADSYRVAVWGAYKKCPGCAIFLGDTGLRILSPLPPSPIVGPETVYVGGTYSYEVVGGPFASIQWYRLPDLTNSLGSTSPISVNFSTVGTDTLLARYRAVGSCPQISLKIVVVKACPTGAQVIARTPGVCLGQQGTFEVIDYATPFDSVRWQFWDGTAWVNVPAGPGTTSTLLITPPLYQGPVIARAVLYYGPCQDFSAPDTIRVSSTFLSRDFYALVSPVCVGDTSWLQAAGSGVWTTTGAGEFTDTLDPLAGYIPAPSDVGTVQICWVVRSQDLTQCRDVSKDTLCLSLTVQGTDAAGSFAVPPTQGPLCLGDISEPLTGQITAGTTSFWTTNGAGYFSPDPFSNPVRYVSAPGDAGRWVHITWNVRGTCGRAVYTDSIFVQPGSTAQIQGPNQICENVVLRLAAQVTGTMDSLLWFQGSVASVLAAGPPSRSHPQYLGEGPSYETLDLSAGQDTFLLVGFAAGCKSFSQLPITILPAPTAAFTLDPSITTMNNPTVQFTSQSQGATIYVWEFGDPNNSTQDSVPDPTFTYSAPGSYTVVLFVQNDVGCSNFSVCANCVRVLPRRVYLPNAFSPNGDGKNDLFRVLPIEDRIPFTRLEVFDRWGQPVFAADNLPSWDGRSNSGVPLDPGTYSYRAIIFVPDEGLVTHTGVVHLTR